MHPVCAAERKPEEVSRMNKHHYHAVIWIDHHEARVFHFSPTDVEQIVLHPDHPSTFTTRQIRSAADMKGRITPIYRQSRIPSQMQVRFSSLGQRMQRPNWSSIFTTTVQS